MLFDEAPRLSGDMWLALATCEAISRSGGTIAAMTMQPVLDEWREGGRLPAGDGGLGSLAIQAAPLAFVLHPDDERDLQSLQALLPATNGDAIAHAAAVATLAAVRECVERNRAPDLRLFSAGHTVPFELSRAIALAGEHVDDLEAAITAMGPDDTRAVACLTGLLLGAAGCEIPRALLLATPERGNVDAIVEPFTQCIAAGSG